MVHRITVSLSDEEHAALQQLAGAIDTTMSAVCRRAIQFMFEHAEKELHPPFDAERVNEFQREMPVHDWRKLYQGEPVGQPEETQQPAGHRVRLLGLPSVASATDAVSRVARQNLPKM